MPIEGTAWPQALYTALRGFGVNLFTSVPDAGHRQLLELAAADPDVTHVALTSEQEGIGVTTGAWLGGRRGVLLMQSSGVGNCVNAIASFPAACHLPLLMLVTMRGEWGEGNPWQIPMGQAVEPVFRTLGVQCLRLETGADAEPVLQAAATLAFDAGSMVAVVISQRLIGAKVFQ